MDKKDLVSEQGAVDQLQEAINGVLGKRWMVAVWSAEEIDTSVKSKLIILSNRTTWHFPHSGFEAAVKLLRENLEKEMEAEKAPPVPAPLQMAPFVLDSCSEIEAADSPPLGRMLDNRVDCFMEKPEIQEEQQDEQEGG